MESTEHSAYDYYSFSNFLFLSVLFWLSWVLIAARGIFTGPCKLLSCSLRTLSYAMWDLAPWAGIKRGSPALGGWSPSHWMTRNPPIINLIIVLTF